MREKLFENLPDEVWRNIDEFPDYEISSFGRVCHRKPDYLIKSLPCSSISKHQRVGIKHNGRTVHRLVARAFPEICGEWFDGCQVHHLDKNPLNNRADNLKVCTMKEHYSYHYEELKERCIKRNGKGADSPMYGKKHTEEFKKKMSDFMKGKPKTKESIEKRLNTRANPVIQYTLDGDYVAEYRSLGQLEGLKGYAHSLVKKCCIGEYKQAYGYIWKYKKDIDNSEKYLED